jgi:selenocysteine lyase/cysteine desulfurase
MPTLNIEAVRAKFPALENGYIYADNAGGSQITKAVADMIYDYLLYTNVQLGADYSTSVTSTTRVCEAAPRAAMKLFNSSSPDEVVFGSSSTLNLENLARSLDASISADDEFIITGEHEGEHVQNCVAMFDHKLSKCWCMEEAR